MKFLDCIMALSSFGAMLYLVNTGIWLSVPLSWFGMFAVLYGVIWCVSSLLMLHHSTLMYGVAVAIAGKPRQKTAGLDSGKGDGKDDGTGGKANSGKFGRFEFFNWSNRIILAMFFVWVIFSAIVTANVYDETDNLAYIWILLCFFVVVRTRIGFDYIIGFIHGFKKGLSKQYD